MNKSDKGSRSGQHSARELVAKRVSDLTPDTLQSAKKLEFNIESKSTADLAMIAPKDNTRISEMNA